MPTTQTTPKTGLHESNSIGRGPAFEVRAALGQSRKTFAQTLGVSYFTLRNAEHRGGTLAGAPGLKVMQLACNLPDSRQTPALREWIAKQKAKNDALRAVLGSD